MTCNPYLLNFKNNWSSKPNLSNSNKINLVRASSRVVAPHTIDPSQLRVVDVTNKIRI